MKLSAFIKAILLLPLLLISVITNAALVDIKENNNVIYALYAAPNKVVRYDLATENFLEDIRLDYTPNNASFYDGNLYFSAGNDIYRLEQDLQTQTLIASIRTHEPDDIIHSLTITSELIIANDGRNTFLFNKNNHTFIKKQWDHTGSSENSSIVLSPTTLIRSSYYAGCQKIEINIEANDLDKTNCGRQPRNSRNTDQSSLALRGKTLYANNGYNYDIDSLGITSSYGLPYDDIAFSSNNRVVIVRGEKLSYLEEKGKLLGQYTLNSKSSYITTFNNSLFSLSSGTASASIEKVSIDNILWEPLAASENDSNIFSYDFIASNNSDKLYFINNKELAIHEWSIDSLSFTKIYPIRMPVSALYHHDNTLFLGGSNGSFSHIDLSSDSPAQIFTGFIGEKVDWTASLEQNKLVVMGIDNLYLFTDDHELLDHKPIHYSGLLSFYFNHNDASYYYTSARASHIFNTDSNEINILSNYTNYPDLSYDNKLFSFNSNAQLMIADNGKIYQPGRNIVLNQLSEEIANAAWFDENLITLDKAQQSLKVWNQDFENTSTRTIHGNKAEIFNLAGDLVVVENQPQLLSNQITVNKFGFSSDDDQDNDNIIDILDNCPAVANTDQTDTDQDNYGNACDSDDDNDQIPDSNELENNLNPLDSSDAEQDLDQDGFSNLVEYRLNTEINDANSKPAKVDTLTINFNDGSMGDMYTGIGGWRITTDGINNTQGLVSSTLNNSEESSSVFLTKYFSDGILSFSHRVNENNHYYILRVFIDGVLARSFDGDESWESRYVTITEGIHTVELRLENRYGNSYRAATHYIDNLAYSGDIDGDEIPDNLDNCPTISNRWQQDYNYNGIGDDCEGDYADDDADGIQKQYDNCPEIANPEQENLDYDQYGDACDTDIDGDGISNTVEEQYDFLDPRNGSDAYEDEDQDGVSNVAEIQNGSDPETFNEREVISLFEYFPLGNIDISTIYGNVKIRPTNKANEYKITLDESSSYSIYRVTNNGIELIESYNDFENITYFFDGFMRYPARMQLGDTLNFEYTVRSSESSAPIQTYSTAITLEESGTVSWNGETYQYVTISHDGYTSESLLKGLGSIYDGTPSLGTLEVTNVTINQLGGTPVTGGLETKPLGGSSSSGGAINPLWIFLLSMLLFTTRRRLIKQ